MEQEQEKSASANRCWNALSIVALVFDLVSLAVLCYATVFLAARFATIFRDFDMQLPILSEWLLRVPDGVYLAGFVGLGVLLVLKEIGIRNALLKLAVNALAGLGLLAFGALWTIAIFLPLVTLIDRLN